MLIILQIILQQCCSAICSLMPFSSRNLHILCLSMHHHQPTQTAMSSSELKHSQRTGFYLKYVTSTTPGWHVTSTVAGGELTLVRGMISFRIRIFFVFLSCLEAQNAYFSTFTATRKPTKGLRPSSSPTASRPSLSSPVTLTPITCCGSPRDVTIRMLKTSLISCLTSGVSS